MKSLQALFTAVVRLLSDSLKCRKATQMSYERVRVYNRNPRRGF